MTWSKHTTFDAAIGGDAHCTFTRNVASSDPDGTARAVDEPRYGHRFGFGPVAETLDNVYDQATGATTICIGSGVGADGVWFSVWYEESGTNSGRLIAIRESDQAVKTSAAFDIGTYADMTQGAHDYNRFVPRASTSVNILPGGLWLLPCRRDYDSSEGSNTWYAWGTSLLVRQGVTYDNVFDAAMTVHDEDNWYDSSGTVKTGFIEGLIDSTTTNPHPNTKLREWSSAVTPVSEANDEMNQFADFWFTFTDYQEASYIEATSVHTTPKPGGSVYIVHCTRTPGNGTWTIGSVREVVQQEDPGPTSAFYNDTDTSLYQHYHSAIAVKHSTGELDVVAFIGDLTHRAWTRRFRVADPANYTTSTINEQRDQVGATEAFGSPAIGSPQLICPQLGQQPNELFVATDIRHEALLKMTVPRDLTAPLQTEAVIDRGLGVAGIIDVSMAYVLHLMVARPWERKGYYCNVSAYLNDYTDWCTTLMYSETGEPGTWIEFSEYRNRVGIAAGGAGVWMWPYNTIDATTGLRYAYKPTGTLRQPILVEPGGAQRFAATNARTQVHTSNAGKVTVTSLTKNGSGQWLDTDGTTVLDPQPPMSPLVVKIESTVAITDSSLDQSICQLSVSDKGTNTTFELGDVCSRVYFLVDPASPRGHALIAGPGYRSSPMGGADRAKAQPTSTKTWIPHLVYTPTDRVSTYEFSYRFDSRSDDIESPVLAGNVSTGVVTLPVSFYVAFSSLTHATSGELMPAYGMSAGATGADESLVFDLPTIDVAYACALNLMIPRGCPDSMYARVGDGTNDSRYGETVYWSWYVDADNKAELALDRTNRAFKLAITDSGVLQETITVSDIWLIAEGVWAVRVSQGADRKWRIAVRHSGNRITGAEGSYSCSWTPTNHRAGDQAGNVANVGVFEALDQGVSWSPTLAELQTLAYQTDLTLSGVRGMGLSQLNNAILAASPLRYFRFNESSGDLIDYGSFGQDLTLTASPTVGVDGPLAGQLAYTFNGTTQDCRNTTAFSTLNDGDATFYCIFRSASATPPGADVYLFQIGNGTRQFVAVFEASTGKVKLMWVNSARTYKLKTQASLYDGAWHRLCVHMHNELAADAYTATIDGVAVSLDVLANAVGDDDGTIIAGRLSGARFPGTIAKLAFWNSDASASFDGFETAYNASAYNPLLTPGLGFGLID